MTRIIWVTKIISIEWKKIINRNERITNKRINKLFQKIYERKLIIEILNSGRSFLDKQKWIRQKLRRF